MVKYGYVQEQVGRLSEMKKIRAYKLGDGKVHIIKDVKGTLPENANTYPEMKCPYKECNCNSNCAFFKTNWNMKSSVYCGKVKIGILK